jgi:hypothetical protein
VLNRLRFGDDSDLPGRESEVVGALLPLLMRIESLHKIGIPIAQLEALIQKGREPDNRE